ncbi:MAG: nucleotidyltransferase domain-containing protein [Candidatus Sabulitectum sp.]|nr:nucleotidyltransferase domain-containing protein [Candidatus Sabulitectum sp.]
MKTDRLNSRYKDIIINILAANPRVEQIVLFGSRAINTFTPTSDIDLALFGDELTLSDQANLVDQIHHSVVPFEVDLLRYSSVSNRELLEHIIRDGVVWYSKIDSLHRTQQ